jgi:hypothetical protein
MTPDLETTPDIDFDLGPVGRHRVMNARAALDDAQDALVRASQAYRDAVRSYYREKRRPGVTHKAVADDLGISTTALNDLLRPSRRRSR